MRQLRAACPDGRIAPDELAARAAAQGAGIIAGLRRITGGLPASRPSPGLARETAAGAGVPDGFFGMAAAPVPMT